MAKNKFMFFSILSSFLLFLSLNFAFFWWFVFPAIFMLLSLRKFIYWFISGLIFFTISLWWINISMIKYGGVSWIISYILIFLLCLFITSIQFGITFTLWKLFKFNLYVLPIFWTLAEIFRSYFPYSGFPWLILGNFAVNVPFLGLSLRYLTVYGISIITLYIIVFIYLLLIKRKVIYAFASFLQILLLFILSVINDKEIDQQILEAERIRIAIIQPFINQRVKLNEFEFREASNIYFPLIEQAIDEGAKIVFLPEYAFPFLFSQGYDDQFLKLMELSYKAVIVVGLVDFHFSEEGIKPHTSAYMIHKGREIDRYDKIRLLPFGEYVPFPFNFVKDLFPAVSGPDYVAGSDYTPLSYRGLNIATFICFEVGYVDLVKRVAKKSNLIAVLTNDGWFDNSLGVYQHLDIARARAIENGKYLIWVNNTGPSAVVNPKGKIVAVIEYGVRSLLVADVYLIN